MQSFSRSVPVKAAVMTLFACLALSLGGPRCFNPDTSQVTFSCTPEDPRCPEGFECSDGICLAVGATPPDATGPRPDMADLPDLAARGCVGAGSPVGAAWACPGLFATGQADSLCAPGFSVCADASAVNLGACDALTGFYVSEALGKSNFRGLCRNIDPVNFTCEAPPPNFLYRLRFGCGSMIASYVLLACQRQCGGFDRALNCSATGADYSCAQSNALKDDSNSHGAIGVLCCPKR